jgi:phage shock protein A
MTPEEMKSIFNKAGEAGDPFLTNKASTRQLEALARAIYEDAARIAQGYGIEEKVAYQNLPRACEDIAAAIRARAKAG